MEAAVYDKIDAYLSKQLTDVQRVTFEQEIAQNDALKELTVRMQLLRKITQRSRIRSKIVAIHKMKTREWRQPVLKVHEEAELPLAAEPEQPDEEETGLYEHEKSDGWKYVVTTVAALLLMIAGGFYFLATSPVTVRKMPVRVEDRVIRLDSLQTVFVEIYNEGVKSIKKENYLAADTYFKNVIDFQDLPAYYTDAAIFFRVATTARQKPTEATDRYEEVFTKRCFGYPYTNKDKLQLWCKIQWARLKGWK